MTERLPVSRRERQDEMLGAVDVGLWYCDLPFDVLEWDRKVKEHFWLPADAGVTIELFYERLHPDDRARTRAAIDHSIATQTPYDIEYRTVAPEGAAEAGRIRWVRALGYTAYDAAGQPIRFDGVTVDVTSQKLAEERLAASEQRYEYASRATSNAIWDWDLTTDHVTWNAGVHSVFGYTPAEVEETAAWWYDHIHPDDRERVVSGVHEVIDGPPGAHAWQEEYRYRRADGSYARIVDRGYLARDPEGRAVRMIGAMEDVTERLQAEEPLRLSEERFRALVDQTDQYIWTTTSAGLMSAEQPGWTRLTGQSYAQYQGLGWADALHPEDRDRVLAKWRDAVAARTAFEDEHRVRAAGGGYRDFWVRGIPVFESDGSVREWVGVHADITERRAAERATEEHARVVETLQHVGRTVASELDLETLVQAVTDAATRLTGAEFGAFFYNVVSDRGEAYTLYTISGVPREAFSKFPMPRNTPVFATTFHGLGTIRSDDITKDPRYGQVPPHHGMPSGHLPVTSYLAVPVISRTEEVLGGLFFGHSEPGRFEARHEQLADGIAGWASVAMDNARLYQAEHQARAEAERANHTKSEFLATMSHELRTPLNAMLGYTDLLLAGIPTPLPEGIGAKVERIGISARHLLELIEEILSFSRLEAGEERIDVDSIELGVLLDEVQALSEPLALAKGLRYTCSAPAGLAPIESDARKLRQILVNLIGNAIKFTSEGEVALSVALVGDEVAFSVSDTGPGIDPEHLERIFEPFWQVDGGITRTVGGTGLGLSVTRRLARLLGGDVLVESTPGAGTTFTARVPMHPPALPLTQ